jgi:hypothetical protein
VANVTIDSTPTTDDARGSSVTARGSWITRRQLGAGAAGAAVTAIAAALIPDSASAVDDDFPDPRGLPKTFELITHGTVARGATVQTDLSDGHYLGLFVGQQLSATMTHPVGLVDLGYHDAGSHRLAWNLEVAGTRLAAGSYLVLLEVFTPHGYPSGIPPTSTYAFLTITGDGRTGVRLVPLKSLL